ncbi:hypothetical protein CEXT_782841 [Caerostris extrusa]|uniref:Uncharacterized protein n=1 Tax=Caerostris extrusa TaxID=172846 RepID=A0AAV4RTX1_CAEEX|nr:hypothetical protein CEXT_782841 [Caerostris extrusa]
MIPICDIGFVDHCHFAFYGKWHCSSGDIPICPSRPPVGLYNGRHYLPNDSLPRTFEPMDGRFETYPSSAFPTMDTTVWRVSVVK